MPKTKMQQNIAAYSYYDKKAERYDTPFFAHNDLWAKRAFYMAIERGDSYLSTFFKEIALYRVGSFDVVSGEITIENVLVVEGKDVIKQLKGDSE